MHSCWCILWSIVWCYFVWDSVSGKLLLAVIDHWSTLCWLTFEIIVINWKKFLKFVRNGIKWSHKYIHVAGFTCKVREWVASSLQTFLKGCPGKSDGNISHVNWRSCQFYSKWFPKGYRAFKGLRLIMFRLEVWTFARPCGEDGTHYIPTCFRS